MVVTRKSFSPRYAMEVDLQKAFTTKMDVFTDEFY